MKYNLELIAEFSKFYMTKYELVDKEYSMSKSFSNLVVNSYEFFPRKYIYVDFSIGYISSNRCFPLYDFNCYVKMTRDDKINLILEDGI